jgi:hypothetical protein
MVLHVMINALRHWLLEDKILKGLKALTELVFYVMQDLKSMNVSIEGLKSKLQDQVIASSNLVVNADNHVKASNSLIGTIEAFVCKLNEGEDYTSELLSLKAVSDLVSKKACSVLDSIEAVKAADSAVSSLIKPTNDQS